MSGAVILPVEIDGQAFRLTFKFGSMRLAEQELGKPITTELASGGVGLDVLSCLFWAALQPHHRMVRDASDDLVDQAGLEQVGKWIGEGLGRYFGTSDPAPREAARENDVGERRPGKKTRGY